MMNQIQAITAHLDNLRNRAQMEKRLRQWFGDRDFIEINTPVILPYSSLEESIEPLTVTLHSDLNERNTISDMKQHHGFLRVSPELSLKKILIGLPKIFELGPCFRDLEKNDSPEHLNEFTLLEWYHTGITLQELIQEFIDLIQYLTTWKNSNNKKNNLRCSTIIREDWEILSIAQAFQRYADIDFDQWTHWEEIINVAKKQGFNASTLNDAFYWLFLNKVEPHIRSGPTIIYEYPIFQASFSQGVKRPTKINHNSLSLEYGLRFEAYLGNMEICNGFQELLDSVEQRKRWQVYLDNLKRKGFKKSLATDNQFLAALQTLQQHQQPVSGIAVGWERLLMFLFDAKNIREVQPLAPW